MLSEEQTSAKRMGGSILSVTQCRGCASICKEDEGGTLQRRGWV